MSEKKLVNPSVLAFEAKLIPSDALMFAVNWSDRSLSQPILVTEKSVRGTISNRLKDAIGNNSARVDGEVSKANLQTVDTAALPHTMDTLKLSFTLRVLGGLAIPCTCNNPDYQTVLADKIQQYQQQHGFKELSLRYANNLANGRFLWRNRVGAEALAIVIKVNDKKFTFDSYQFSLQEFSADVEVAKLAAIIATGLSEQHVLISVEAYAKLGNGQTVYPSQELVLGGGKGDKNKVLYHLDQQAAIHSQKIGNALRTIDTWYPNAAQIGPISIEPYGSVTNRGTAYRQPKEKNDFYNLLDHWLLKNKEPNIEQQHYIMAMLIRGGVFGE